MLSTALSGMSLGAPSAVGVAPETAQKLQAVIDGMRDEDGLPGGIILRVESLRDGRVWEGASGPFDEAAATPLRPTDGFRIASITKAFTAAVVWRLAEEGTVRLDDSIAKYLDPSLVNRLHVLNGVNAGAKITVKQLLCHCSGLYDYATDRFVLRDMFVHPTKRWTPLELIDAALSHGQPYFPPGQGQHYSDTGYLVLGLIIEKVTGKPVAQVYHELLFDPLGMPLTYLDGREPATSIRLSHNYVEYLDIRHYDPTLDAYASGGHVSTARELAAFIRGVMGGRVFKKQATLRASLEEPVVPAPVDTRPDRPRSGFMFHSFTQDGVKFIGHGGFWGGVMFYQPERQLIITGTTNQEKRRLTPHLAKIAKIMIPKHQ